jgi:hypoxanthine phosphoribosyltransferase
VTTRRLPDVCDRVLISEADLRRRIAELGSMLTEDFAQSTDLRLVTVLKGGLFFLADLCRTIDLALSVDFMAVSPYQVGVGGRVQLTKDLSDDIRGADVVLVEDIVDTGLTINYVLGLLRAHEPARLSVCALLDKPARRIADVPIDYRGFLLPDRFVVGYGLDVGGLYRNLSYIASLKEEAVLP